MTQANQAKLGKTIGVIIGIIVVAIAVQFSRFYSKTKDLKQGMAVVLPNNFFPFQGNYTKNAAGKVVKL